MKDILGEMEKSHTYGGIFPETWKLMNIMMALPVGTTSVERSFSQIKLIKTCLCSNSSDLNLEHLIKFAIEGPNSNRKIDIFNFNYNYCIFLLLHTSLCCCLLTIVTGFADVSDFTFWLLLLLHTSL